MMSWCDIALVHSVLQFLENTLFKNLPSSLESIKSLYLALSRSQMFLINIS